MVELEAFGKKYAHDPMWTGPLEKIRRPTDEKYTRIFAVFIFLWFCMAFFSVVSDSQTHDDWNNSTIAHELSVIREKLANLDGNKSEGVDDSLSASANGSDISNDSDLEDFLDMIRRRQHHHFENTIWKSMLTSAILSILYISVLKWCTVVIVYAVITSIFTVVTAFTCYAGATYAQSNDSTDMIILIAGALIDVVLLLFFVCYRKRIKISCEVIKEACECVNFFRLTVLLPAIPLAVFTIIIMCAKVILTHLISISHQYATTPLYLHLFHVINIIGAAWIGSIVLGFLHMTLCGTFATWYWTREKNYVPNFTILRFMNIISKYHFGSLVLGSTIIVACRLINMVLKSTRRVFAGKCNPCVCCCESMFEHFFGRLLSFVMYINRNAYIMVAVHGYDFFTAAKEAFHLSRRNIVSTLISHQISDRIVSLGKYLIIMITLTVVAISEDLPAATLRYTLIPALIISYITTTYFFIVIRAAIETIFHCVLEDSERNDGSSEKPYYMSFKLRNKIIDLKKSKGALFTPVKV